MTDAQLWYILAMTLFALEVVVPGFILANTALGALTAGILAHAGMPLSWQLALCGCVTMISIMTLRPYLRRRR